MEASTPVTSTNALLSVNSHLAVACIWSVNNCILLKRVLRTDCSISRWERRFMHGTILWTTATVCSTCHSALAAQESKQKCYSENPSCMNAFGPQDRVWLGSVRVRCFRLRLARVHFCQLSRCRKQSTRLPTAKRTLMFRQVPILASRKAATGEKADCLTQYQ